MQTAAPRPDQRIAVAGGRVLTVTGTARDGTCYYDVVLGVDPVGRDEVIAARDGRVLWHGAAGEDVLAVDNGYAVVRSARRRSW